MNRPQLNEVKRLQELAGVIVESEQNSVKDEDLFNDVPSIDISIQTDEQGQDTLIS